MKGFLTVQQGLPNRLVTDLALSKKRSRHGQRLFSIIRGLPDTPWIPPANVPRNDVARPAVETGYPAGYQFSMSVRANISVCFPTASPAASPLKQAIARSSQHSINDEAFQGCHVKTSAQDLLTYAEFKRPRSFVQRPPRMC